MPPLDGNPDALQCQAPEFLDFLIGAELPERQKLYRDGLDTLNASAKKKFKKPFADLDDADADAIVRPLADACRLGVRPAPDPLRAFHRSRRAATSAPPRRIRASGQPRAVRRDAVALAAAELTCCPSTPFTGAN